MYLLSAQVLSKLNYKYDTKKYNNEVLYHYWITLKFYF